MNKVYGLMFILSFIFMLSLIDLDGYVNNHIWKSECISKDNINYSGTNPSVTGFAYYDCAKIQERFCWSEGLNVDECLQSEEEK